MQDTHKAVWNRFCDAQNIQQKGCPLFDYDESLSVRIKRIGKDNRPILCRSTQMEQFILDETDKLVEDLNTQTNKYDGLIYMMYTLEANTVIPLYIGKSETVGKTPNKLSTNLRKLHRDKSKFARWGDNYAYHIGDLSACVLPDHRPQKRVHKYERWAETLFSETQTYNPILRFPIFFWCKAWSYQDTGIWEAFGPTKLTFLEYLMIGVASSVFPNRLLNHEGRNR